jgi:hypothetical protein
MAFPGQELRAYDKNKEDLSGDIALLMGCLEHMRMKRSTTHRGLQNRLTLPPASMYGAIDLGGPTLDTTPVSKDEVESGDHHIQSLRKEGERLSSLTSVWQAVAARNAYWLHHCPGSFL